MTRQQFLKAHELLVAVDTYAMGMVDLLTHGELIDWSIHLCQDLEEGKLSDEEVRAFEKEVNEFAKGREIIEQEVRIHR